jgi:hypothetical protein
MADKLYQVAVLLTVPASDYYDAIQVAEKVANKLTSYTPYNVEAVNYFERNKDGRRVLYLHNENEPMPIEEEKVEDNYDAWFLQQGKALSWAMS